MNDHRDSHHPTEPGYPLHPEEEVVEQEQAHGDHGDDGDHDAHAGHSVAMFRSKFWLSLILTVPVVFWAEHVQMLLGYTAPPFPGSDWIGPVLSTVIFFYGGWVFVRGALGELRARLPGMMTLISLAIVVAFVFSWVVELGLLEAEPIWWELATLVTIMLLGHWIEMRSINQAQGALQELAKLLPDTARRIGDDGAEEEVPVTELRRGDLVLVRPGRERAGGWRGAQGRECRERGHDHGRVAAGEEGRERRGHRRNHQRRGLAASGGDGNRG